MDINTIINQVLILFLIMLVGFIAKKKSIITDEVSKKFSELLLAITSPFMIISSFQVKFSQEMFKNVLIIFAFALAVHALSIVIGKLLFSGYTEDTKKILKFSAIYSNCGFMGFPLLQGLYGKTGVLYGSVYGAAFNIFLWTNGVMLFSGKKDSTNLKKVLMNPGITSVIFGFLIFVFSIKLPYPIAKTIDMVGAMNAPLSMLVVGASLADIDFRKLLSGFPMYYSTFVRLVFIPLLTLITLKMVGLNNTLIGTCVLLVAMPVAASSTIFAEKFGGDSHLASRIVAFSTLACIVTIPMVLTLV